MYKPESILKNEMHEISWDFEIQTNPFILVRRVDQVSTRKKELVDFVVPVDHRIKMKESEKIKKYLDLAWELKNLWNLKVTVIPITVDVLRTVPKGLEKRIRNRRKNPDFLVYNIVEFGQNI